jgi:DNA-binding IclR family transcriptional regulator
VCKVSGIGKETADARCIAIAFFSPNRSVVVTLSLVKAQDNSGIGFTENDLAQRYITLPQASCYYLVTLAPRFNVGML